MPVSEVETDTAKQQTLTPPPPPTQKSMPWPTTLPVQARAYTERKGAQTVTLL